VHDCEYTLLIKNVYIKLQYRQKKTARVGGL
jgi:hypothetical protein